MQVEVFRMQYRRVLDEPLADKVGAGAGAGGGAGGVGSVPPAGSEKERVGDTWQQPEGRQQAKTCPGLSCLPTCSPIPAPDSTPNPHLDQKSHLNPHPNPSEKKGDGVCGGGSLEEGKFDGMLHDQEGEGHWGDWLDEDGDHEREVEEECCSSSRHELQGYHAIPESTREMMSLSRCVDEAQQLSENGAGSGSRCSSHGDDRDVPELLYLTWRGLPGGEQWLEEATGAVCSPASEHQQRAADARSSSARPCPDGPDAPRGGVGLDTDAKANAQGHVHASAEQRTHCPGAAAAAEAAAEAAADLEGAEDVPPQFRFFIEKLLEPTLTPDFLGRAGAAEARIKQRNVWLGCSVTSQIHFDALDNLHVVLEGLKTFHLYSPWDAVNLYPQAWQQGSLNNRSEVRSILSADRAAHPRFFQKAVPLTAQVCAGEAIFIPAGWWHEVFTHELTCSANAWFTPPPAAQLRPTLMLLRSVSATFKPGAEAYYRFLMKDVDTD
eukprot:jgi/Mesen1/7347/ME000377S06564